MQSLILLVFLMAGLAGFAGESGNSVAVVYNKRLPASKAVAEHYARLRRVPDRQVIGFDLPTDESMSRAEFQNRLQRPLFDYLVVMDVFQLAAPEAVAADAVPGPRVGRSSIRYLVLCHGVPLKIRRDPALVEEQQTNLPPVLRRDEAAVDSELTWLPLSRKKTLLAGPLPNPFYGATNCSSMTPSNGILLVARLDGPTPEVAQGLVDKALDAEAHGLWGRAYFDTRGLTGGQYILGDQWIRGAAAVARQMGFETVLDEQPQTFAADYPLSQVALYAGWYDDHVSGPFARPQIEFMPGAFAYHLHSFSAATLRSASQHWAGPLLAKGATATVGYVDEPYLQFTADLPVLLGLFLGRGASFGEAAWAAERTLSWQTTVIGDPLYRPFGRPLEVLHHDLESRLSRLVEWSHLLIVNRNQTTGLSPQELINYLNQVPLSESSAVLTEKLGDLQQLLKNTPAALASYQKALDRLPSPEQKVRLFETIAELQASGGSDKEAAETWTRLLKECPTHPIGLATWQKLRLLAQKAKDEALLARAELEIKNLTPPPPTNAPPAPPTTR